MEYQPSKKEGNVGSLSRLIPKSSEPFELNVVAAFESVIEI